MLKMELSRFLLPGLILAPAFLLVGCSLITRTVPGGAPLGTPTPSAYFQQDFSPALAVPSPSGLVQTPTLSVLFAGKALPIPATQNPDQGKASPTLSAFFDPGSATSFMTLSAPGSGTATLSVLFRKNTAIMSATQTPRPDGQGQPTPSPSPESTVTPVTPSEGVLVDPKPILADGLNESWSLDNSWGVDWAVDNQVKSPAGHSTVRYKPKEDFGALFFTVKSTAPSTYLRSKTVGFSFLLNPGEFPLGPDQLAITVIGSNEYTYWLKGDTSVASVNEGQMFSETRLYYLNVNRSLPANSWTEITVYLNKLIYDPNYMYVTGAYLKTDRGVDNTLYVADAVLLMAKEP